MKPLHFQLLPDSKVLIFANGIITEDDQPIKKAVIINPDDGWFKIRVDDAMFLFSKSAYVFYYETPDTIHHYVFDEIREGHLNFPPCDIFIKRINDKWDIIFSKKPYINYKGFLGAKAFGFQS